jgi:hypothetical protein
MEIVDPVDEFRPIDDEKLDFLFGLIDACERIGSLDCLSESDRTEMTIIKHNFMVVVSQAMAGYQLYSAFSQIAKDLYCDLNEMIEKTLPPVRPISLRNFETAIKNTEA